MGKSISLTGIMAPCKNCTKKFFKCHGVCPEYKEFVEKNEERKVAQQIYAQNHWESQKTFQKLSTETTWKKRV